MFDFTDQVVMITGGAGNLGRAAARAFADSGARVVVVGRNEEKQHRVFQDWVNGDRHVLVSPYDITTEQGVSDAVADAMQRVDRLDVLINALGGFRGGDLIQDTSPDTWDFLMELNARAVFLVCREVVPRMLEQGHGKIVNVAARSGLKGQTRQTAYAASKSAVISLTESLSAEVRRKGINVNCILPGTIDTPENRQAMPDANFERWVEPESLVRVLQFLASDYARDVHGAALPVYGQS